MTTRGENTVEKVEGGNIQTDKVEEWGLYQCVVCEKMRKAPVFLYPPKDEGRWKGHCNECERQTERRRLDTE